jgi:hypothetical protein
MLFLAVFLGFIAENIREHIADKKRGQEYIRSFVEDLKKDTAQFRSLLYEYSAYDSVTDQITSCYDTVTHHATSTSCLKEIIPCLISFTDFVYTDRTIQQLKNAGGLRSIQNKNVADSIISYDALIRKELIHQDVLENNQAKSIEAIRTVIDFSSFHKIYSQEPETATDPKLLETNNETIDKLFNALWIFKMGLRGQLFNLELLKRHAERLISYLEKNS